MSDSYIRANDPSNYVEVIEIASRAGKYEDLIRYLQMARKTVREPQVDGYLLLSFSKTDRLHDLEDFLSSLNVADVFHFLNLTYNRFLTLARNVITKSCIRPRRFYLQVFPTGLDWHLHWFISVNFKMQLTVLAKPTLQSQSLLIYEC